MSTVFNVLMSFKYLKISATVAVENRVCIVVHAWWEAREIAHSRPITKYVVGIFYIVKS